MAAITTPITATVFTLATRAAGTYTSATAPILEGVGGIGIKDTMTNATASDPANSFLLTVEISLDNGATWRGVFQDQWQGGTHFSKTTQTTVPNHIDTAWANSEMQNGSWIGGLIHAVLVQNNQMESGINAVVYPIGWVF